MIAVCLCACALGASGLSNGDFEQPLAAGAWKLEVGATTGAAGPSSSVVLDERAPHAGKQSLRISGDHATQAWTVLVQDVEARPGAKYTLSAFTRTQDVHAEAGQRANCWFGLIHYDAAGKAIARMVVPPSVPTSAWQSASLTLQAPQATRRTTVQIFLSMSGTLWVDDMALVIEGGSAAQRPARLWSEHFEGSAELPESWTRAIGARQGAGDKSSRIALDAEHAHGDSQHSLRIDVDLAVNAWTSLERRFDVAPGDALTASFFARAEALRREGEQFDNCHARLEFFDASGKRLGPPRSVDLGRGSFAWKRFELVATAPEASARALFGVFQSVSGTLWIDDVELARAAGAVPYRDWKQLAGRHVELFFPPDHPALAELPHYVTRLDAGYERVCAALELTYAERLSVFLYRDDDQGRALTGMKLAFADAEGRAVHQRIDNTISHEMTHVIAAAIGRAQSPLFGEGLAVWLDGTPAETHHERAARLLAEQKLPDLGELLDEFRTREELTYPAAGSFCGYLIERVGMARFKRVYAAADPRAAVRTELGLELDVLDREWRATLAKLR